MFVRKKKRGKYTYHYLVESVRENGKVKQKTLLYLGDYATIDAALEGLPKDVQRFNAKAEEWQNHHYHQSCSSYWRRYAADCVRSYERLVKEHETRLAALKAVVTRTSNTRELDMGTTCSAQKNPSCGILLGTTQRSAQKPSPVADISGHYATSEVIDTEFVEPSAT
ncbi:MAG: hypothetical protein ACYTG0_25910 [Planctomycetota bacterium]|jgi:hypothetical protein